MASFTALVLLACSTTVWNVWYVRGLHDGLSPIADDYSESNGIRAGESYAVRGFFYRAGVPATTYGSQFPNKGGKTESSEVQAEGKGEGFYSHYPPGADMILGLATLVFGKGKVDCFRTIPIAIHLLSMSLLAWVAWQSFLPWRACLALLLVVSLPPTYTWAHGLHYQGYTLSLLVAQAAVILAPRWANRTKALFITVLAGFQGAIGREYAPLVVLLPWVLSPLSLGTQRNVDRKVMLKLCLWSAIGFGIPQAFHLIQISYFHGGFWEAVSDLRNAAAKRSLGTGRFGVWQAWLLEPFRAWIKFLFKWTSETGRFPFAVGVLLVLWILAASKPGVAALGRAGVRFDTALLSIALRRAMFASSLWIVIMRQHSVVHQGMIYRNFWIVYFVVIWGVVQSFEFPAVAGKKKFLWADARP